MNHSRLALLAPIVLRLAMAGVFLWFGTAQLVNPNDWTGFLPEFLLNTQYSPNLFVFLNGLMEVILAVFLIPGIYVRFSALILSLHLFGIAWLVGINPIGIRDAGLAFATLAVSLNGYDVLSLDTWFNDRRLQGKSLTANNLIHAGMLFVAVVIALYSLFIYMSYYSVFKEPGKKPELNIPGILNLNSSSTPGPTSTGP